MLLDKDTALTFDVSDLSGPSPDERSPSAPDRTTVGPKDALPDYVPQPARYGEQRGVNVSAMGIAIGVHVLLGLALLGFGVQSHAAKRTRLVTMDLSAPPPAPPPPPAPEKAVQQKLPVSVEQHVEQVTVIPTPPIALAPATITAPPVPVAVVAPPAPPAPAAAPAAAPSIVSSANLGTRMISGAPPRYPQESRRKREQGTVELSLVLGVDGAVEAISIRQSSGFAALDQAALNAVRRWRWTPTVVDGSPVKVRGVVEIPFVLKV